MLFVKVSFIILLSVYLVFLVVFSYKSGSFIKTLLLSAISGLAVLAVVNIFSRATGVDLAVNGWTVGSSAFLGLPAVLGMLVIRLFF